MLNEIHVNPDVDYKCSTDNPEKDYGIFPPILNLMLLIIYGMLGKIIEVDQRNSVVLDLAEEI